MCVKLYYCDLQAIEAICSVNADILDATAGYLPRRDSEGDQTLSMGAYASPFSHTPPHASPPAAFSVSMQPAPVRPGLGLGAGGGGRGAGCILASPLCAEGWRFPPVVLTDADDRYLFDIEVEDLVLIFCGHVTNSFLNR